MTLLPHIFREYDIRGIVDVEIDVVFATMLGKAIGTTLLRGGGKRIVMGRDCRLSGLALSQALCEGLLATGCDVIDIGMVSTPVQYWAIHHLKTDAGVCVTGSHNPPNYNGFKMTVLGRSFFGDDIQQLYALMQQQSFEQGCGASSKKEVTAAYIAELSDNLAPGSRGLKVVVDAGNGMGGLTALPLYRNLGFEVVDMYCEPDGTFPNHHADPTVAENLAELQKEVVAQKADVGIAFDGDADRLGVIDRQGEIIWGDQLMIVLSRALLREVPGAVILSEVKSSRTLYDDIKERGGQAVMWRTGHSIMKQKMQEIDAALAGEMSGHVFYKHRFYGFDDAVYAGGRLLEILSHDESAASISEQLSDVPTTFSTPELRVECAEENPPR